MTNKLQNIVTVIEDCQHWILHILTRRPINKTMLSILFTAITENTTSQVIVLFPMGRGKRTQGQDLLELEV